MTTFVTLDTAATARRRSRVTLWFLGFSWFLFPDMCLTCWQCFTSPCICVCLPVWVLVHLKTFVPWGRWITKRLRKKHVSNTNMENTKTDERQQIETKLF